MFVGVGSRRVRELFGLGLNNRINHCASLIIIDSDSGSAEKGALHYLHGRN